MLVSAQSSGPDRLEREIPDSAAAKAFLSRHHPALLLRLQRSSAPLLERLQSADAARYEAAILLATVRLGVRHGSLGADYHAYHNEEHVLELLESRLPRLVEADREGSLGAADWALLGLFAACHDLRQREPPARYRGVGANELASIAESFRILKSCGFDEGHDREVYRTLELMIAGSSFDASPPPPNPAEALIAAGALAPQLPELLRSVGLDPAREDGLAQALRLACIASDLDIGNVAESFPRFCESSARLCIEREHLAGRSLSDEASFEPVLRFLTDGQEHFFFDLHRFSDPLGERAFAAAKAANAPRVRALAAALRERFADGRGTGEAVLTAFLEGAGLASSRLRTLAGATP
ncbi:MAG: hypothetical protein KatS3mg125_0565 [Lysobacterales bacterium]|nr:MAG: hypothetical protein KatS3mg125_0565 [Xanthomonadales bacterium]